MGDNGAHVVAVGEGEGGRVEVSLRERQVRGEGNHSCKAD